MSVELVNRIKVSKDGIYIHTHSNNDTDSFHWVRLDQLSKDFINPNIAEWYKESLLQDFIALFGRMGSCRLVGNYDSVALLRNAMDEVDNKDSHAARQLEEQLKVVVNASTLFSEDEKIRLGNGIEKALEDLRIKRITETYLKSGGAGIWGIKQ